MDFHWTSAQVAFLDAVERLARTELDTNVTERDRTGVFARRSWERWGHYGLPGLPIPAEFGGLGQDTLTTVAALERLGQWCLDNGLLFSLNAHLWTVVMPIWTVGTEAQKRFYLPRLCRGEWIGGNAITEAEAGSDAFCLKTSARREGDRYVLNGHKTFVSNGPIADVFTVYATVDASRGPRGITAFIIPRNVPGLTVLPVEKMGLRTSPTGELVLQDCCIPATCRLGEEGQGGGLFSRCMAWERGGILASAVGSMQRLLNQCVRHAQKRRQFGQPIGKFQHVASKLVEMKVRLETARLLLYHTAWLRDQGRSGYLESAMTKLYLSECWVRCCEDAIQIHGGAGYRVETGLERELRDALGSRLYSGTSEIQKNLIASLLGL